MEGNARGCSSSFAAPDVQETFGESQNFAARLSRSGLATTLMDATTDKDPLVQEQIYNALCYLGESEPEEILHSCDEYLRQHDKVRPGLGALALPVQGGIWARGVVGCVAAASGGGAGVGKEDPGGACAGLTGRLVLAAGLSAPRHHPEGDGDRGEEQHRQLGQKHGQGGHLPGVQ